MLGLRAQVGVLFVEADTGFTFSGDPNSISWPIFFVHSSIVSYLVGDGFFMIAIFLIYQELQVARQFIRRPASVEKAL